MSHTSSAHAILKTGAAATPLALAALFAWATSTAQAAGSSASEQRPANEASSAHIARNDTLNFSFTVPEAFEEQLASDRDPLILYAFCYIDPKTHKGSYAFDICKLSYAVPIESLANCDKAQLLKRIKRSFREETGTNIQPAVELHEVKWQSLPIIGHRMHFDLGGKSCYLNSFRIPIRPAAIRLSGLTMAGQEKQLDDILLSVLASVQGEPADWSPRDRPWTWAERGAEISRTAAWLVVSEIVILLAWYRKRKRQASTARALPPPV